MAELVFAKEWEEFKKKIIPPNAPVIQTQEMQKAFYAGAYVVINMAMSMFDPSTPEPTEEDVGKMHALLHELEAFFAQFIRPQS